MHSSGAKASRARISSPDVLAHLPVDRALTTPLHRQVYDGVRRAILTGMLRPGQRVPSTRALAVELSMSRLPVLMAYDQLLHEGYLEGRTGSGTFVCASPPDRLLRATQAAERARSYERRGSRSGGRTSTQRRRPASVRAGRVEGIRPFRMSLPALDAFPLTLWSRLVARHVRRLAPMHMAYGDPAGVGALRVAIAEHLRTARAVRCEADHVLVVAGSQVGLRVAASVLLRHGDRVAVEEPGYGGASAAFTATGAEIVPVPVDAEGLDVNALAAVRPRVRAVYVTPSHQYPLGMSMSAARRMSLVDWASRNDAWIIEDDYDSEYRYVSQPLGALQGMDPDNRVVYIGTFSKVLFPALRVAYVVAPPSLWDAFLDARDALDGFSPTLYQLALADFLHDGHFARHIRRMRGLYLLRRNALLDGLDRYCANSLTVLNADAGLHVVTLLPDGMRDTQVVDRMAERGLSAMALSMCYHAPHRKHGLILGFGGFDERTLVAAARTLGEILRERT